MASPSSPAAPATSSITFADLLRHYRTAASLTQEELAERAGLSVDAISTLERGTRRTPRRDTVALLATALALPPKERDAFASAARRSPTSALAATPRAPGKEPTHHEEPVHDGHAPNPAPASSSTSTLPHGIVTFLFADIEGSTRLLQQLGGDRYAEVLAELQTLLSTIWRTYHGHELGTQGDRFFAVFARVADALAAAVAAQRIMAVHRWPEGARVRMRMGVHTGSALLTTGRYVGLEVHRAVQIAAAGHGGQMLVSQAAFGEVAKEESGGAYELPDGARLRDLGQHRLRDLSRHEHLYQLVLPDLPAGSPTLRTLDAWPGLRTDLSVVAAQTGALLTVAGLLLPLAIPTFPWVIGLVAGGLAAFLLVIFILAQPLRQGLAAQWRNSRKGVATAVSLLLCLTIVATTLFVTKPTRFGQPQHQGYDFTYIYHHPTHTGGSVVIGTGLPNDTLAPPGLTGPTGLYYEGLWQSCLVQLPDISLGSDGWRADQCAEVPTVENGGESPDQRRTTFHIDPQAVWSDGQPITADDFLFAFQLYMDPHIGGNANTPPFSYMTLRKVDLRTIQIDWSVGYGWYLDVLEQLFPLPLHVYGTGQFAGIYNPVTSAYNSVLAQQLVAQASFNTTIPVDNGPFTVQSVFPPSLKVLPVNTVQILAHSLSRVVLVKNPRFFSKFFHMPTLNQVTILSFARNSASTMNDILSTWRIGEEETITRYRRGELTLTDGLDANILRQLGGIPAREVVVSPQDALDVIAFNQRDVAPNAQANGGVSIFSDRSVRQAFVQAFDRCAAVKALLGTHDCNDPTFHTDEYTVPPIPDYDRSVTLPVYSPAAAAALLDKAGYRVVDGVRRCKDGTTPITVTIVPSLHGTADKVIADHMQQDYARNLQIRTTVVVPQSQPFAHYDEGGVFAIGAFDIGLYNDHGPPDSMEADNLRLTNSAADIPSAQNPAGSNFWGVVDPHIAAELQLSDQSPNVDQRTQVHRALQRYVTQQFYFEPVYIDADVALVKPTLCNFKKWPGNPGAGDGSNTWNMADWYVAPNCT